MSPVKLLESEKVQNLHKAQIVNEYSLVIKRAKHQENDIRATLFLRNNGKVLSLAKGGQKVSSKLKSLIEPFSISEIQIFLPPHGINSRLISGRLGTSNRQIRLNYSSYTMACQCCEVVDLLLPFRAAAPEVFDLLQAALIHLSISEVPEMDWILFSILLMKELGHGDISHGILNVLSPSEQTSINDLISSGDQQHAFDLNPLSPSSLNRALMYIRRQLAEILPTPMKSELLAPNLK